MIGVIIGLYVLANFGEQNRTAAILIYILGGVISGVLFIAGLLLGLDHLLAFVTGGESSANFGKDEKSAVLAFVVGGIGALYLLPAVQRVVARFIPIRPGSPVIYLTVVLGLLLIVQELNTPVEQGAQPLTYTDLLAQDIPFLVLAFVGVGLFVRRSPREAAQRLGFKRPTQAWWWLVALAAIGGFLAVAFGIEAVANVVAPAQQKQVTDVSNVLFSHFNNPFAIVFLGVLAGVVEETLFRGALVPRLGVVLSALLFAALHTQYAVSFATLEVFVLGIGLGWLRKYSGSTWPAIVTHAGYDIAVGLLPLLFK